ncbi:MAG: hypothetical protein HY721_13750 [Planctomycetes bacterium]|nr:hypothetical protein [Planctomycetota bacterium]
MNRVLSGMNLFLLVCLAVLWRLDVSLEERREGRRRADSTFHSLADEATPAAAAVERIELKLPGSDATWVYLKRADGWHLPDHRDAFATGQEIDGLLKALLESRGTVVGRRPQDAAHFGFVPGRTVEASLQDGSGRLLVKALAGMVAPGQRSGECFLAAEGREPILHANANPRPYVAWTPGSRSPPLLDPKVIPSALSRGLAAKVVFGGEAAPAIRELIRREIPLEQRRALGDRGPRFEWFGTAADGEKRLNDNVAFGYLHGLTRLTFEEILGALQGSEALFAQPSLTITLEQDGGAKDTLTLGASDASGRRHILNSATGQVFTITEENARGLTPDVKALLELPPPREEAPAPK